jgi:putative nucleotidyltransferase with HDIG domain
VDASNQVAKGNLKVRLESTSSDELSVLVQTFNQMVVDLNQSKTDLMDSYMSTLAGWTKALELKDKETLGHTERVVEMTVSLARQLGVVEEQIEHIRRGAMLHDIGKMGIPDAILLKPGTLSDREREEIRMHPVYAYQMLKDIKFLVPAINIPFYHHEYWDGSGYPNGLKGNDIPLEARIFAIVDVWDAVCSDRPYHKALPPEEALKIIQKEIGTHFDPAIAELFLDMVMKGNG